MSQTVPGTFILGASKTGLAIGYRVLNLDRTTYSAFSISGVSESAIAGTYYKASGVVAPDNGGYIVVGTSGTDMAESEISPAAPTVAAIQSGLSTLTTSDIDARLVAYDAATGAEADAILAAIAALNDLSSAGAQAAAAAALAAYDAATSADVSAIVTTIAATDQPDVEPGTLVMRTAATYDGEVSGLTSLIYVDWTKAIFTIKYAGLNATDAGATLQIQVSNPGSESDDGILIINGTEATKNQASLSINAGTGVATIHITDNAMAAIVPDTDNYEYDIKFYDSAGNSRATSPMPVIVNPIVTQTV